AAQGPFGGTIAHGYLTLSMLPALMQQLLTVTDVTMGINYGLDRLRLTAPVPVGSKIRARGKLLDTEPKAGGVLYRVEVQVEVEGSDRPALVATSLTLVYS
ncbi:MAG: MaoC family dehydratase, partial [Actinomycetota bacterium]